MKVWRSKPSTMFQGSTGDKTLRLCVIDGFDKKANVFLSVARQQQIRWKDKTGYFVSHAGLQGV